MTAFDEILAWSQTRPRWQRDALRRVVESPELAPTDVADVLELLRAEHGLTIRDAVSIPLAADHIPDTRVDATAVRLLSLGELVGVNAIAPDQTIAFAPDGITVVYGDNGAGKSGYVRVLRKLCRARDPGPAILGNAFEQADQRRCSALVTLRDGDAEVTELWMSDGPGPTALARVSVIDRDSASVLVTGENELAYLPLGLDVPERLVAFCDELRRRLRQELGVAGNADLTVPEIVSTHLGSLGLWPITARTDVDRLPVNPLAEGEVGELERLELAALAPDPTTAAAELRHRLARLAALSTRLENVMAEFSLERLNAVGEAIAEAKAAEELAQAAAEQLARENLLPGTGDDIWRGMWEAARQYAEHDLHVGERFPRSTANCPVCQREIDDETRDRLARLEDFVLDQTSQRLDAARAALRSRRDVVEGMRVGRDTDAAVIAELRELDEALAREVRSTLERLEEMRLSVLRSIDGREWGDVPPAASTVLERLAHVTQRVEAEAAAFERLAGERDDARRRIAELRTRRWVAEHLPAIRSRIAALDRRQRLQRAIDATDTTAITREGSELAERWATQELADAFGAELQLLTSGQVRVVLRRAGGARGVAHHRLELDGAATRGASLAHVVSEGEHRAIALAAFFAEVEATGSSAIVADDPTSSLDHQFRRRIAQRFARLARDRQVIIFTHDVVFLHELTHQAASQRIPIALRQLSREHNRTGISQEGLPWHAQPVNQRVTALTDELPNLRILHNTNDPEYGAEARRVYGRLRQTWERAVEEVLLNEAVVRFSPAVQTQRLRRAVDISEDDFVELEAGMTKCSTWLEGHDAPLAANEALPAPDEIEEDIASLRTWVREIRQRRGG